MVVIKKGGPNRSSFDEQDLKMPHALAPICILPDSPGLINKRFGGKLKNDRKSYRTL